MCFWKVSCKIEKCKLNRNLMLSQNDSLCLRLKRKIRYFWKVLVVFGYMLDLRLLFVILTYTESTPLSKVQIPSDCRPNYFFHIPLVWPARVTTDLSLSLSLSVAQDLNYGQGSLSLSVTFILFDLDGLVSFPDFIAIYLLTLEKKFTPFSPNQWERESFKDGFHGGLGIRSPRSLRRGSPPIPRCQRRRRARHLEGPSSFSPFTHSYMFSFVYVYVCVCNWVCMYVCMSWWKCCLLNW